MNIEEVYEKYKHLDKPLSEKGFCGKELTGQILYELWQSVKESQNKCVPIDKHLDIS